MISYRPAGDLSKSAAITYENMRSYYEHYAVGWQQSDILEQIVDLENWDIVYNDQLIGAIRLSYDNDGCYLRDLQINELYQNKGIGAKALVESIRLAKKSGAKKLQLKVFKISPAHNLYKRNGFTLISEDERFYYMARIVT